MKYPIIASSVTAIAIVLAATTVSGTASHAQIMPKKAATPMQESAPSKAADPALSLEDLFGVTPEPTTNTVSEAEKKSLEALFEQPAPTVVETPVVDTPEVQLPVADAAVAPAPIMDTPALDVSAESANNNDLTIPDMQQMMQQPVADAAPAVVDTQADTAVAPQPAPQPEPVTVVVTEPAVVAPKTVSESTAEKPATKPVIKSTPKVKKRTVVAKPSIPGLLPSEIMKLEAALEQNIANVPPVNNLEMIQQLPSETLVGINTPSSENPVVTPIVPTQINGSSSVGSLNDLLSQQASAINALESVEPLQVNIPSNSAVENEAIVMPGMNAALPDMPTTLSTDVVAPPEDPLAALSAAIAEAKKPVPSIAETVVAENPVIKPVEQPSMPLASQPEALLPTVVKTPVVEQQPNTQPNTLAMVETPETTVPVITQPKLYNQPDNLMTAEMQTAAQQEEDNTVSFATVSASQQQKISTVLFPSFQSRLDSRQQRSTQALINQLNPADKIVLNGYADWTNNGSMEATQYLSERRAEAVKELLVANGIPARQIMTNGKGLDLRGGQSKDRVDVLIVR